MFEPGQQVTWYWQPRGGYGYVIPCRAEVVQVTAKRVRIRVTRIARISRQETAELKWVRPASLKIKPHTSQEDR